MKNRFGYIATLSYLACGILLSASYLFPNNSSPSNNLIVSSIPFLIFGFINFYLWVKREESSP